MDDRYGRIEKSNLPFMFGWLAINNQISVASCTLCQLRAYRPWNMTARNG
jgi:hypothetical protein